MKNPMNECISTRLVAICELAVPRGLGCRMPGKSGRLDQNLQCEMQVTLESLHRCHVSPSKISSGHEIQLASKWVILPDWIRETIVLWLHLTPLA